jgi:DNA primase
MSEKPPITRNMRDQEPTLLARGRDIPARSVSSGELPAAGADVAHTPGTGTLVAHAELARVHQEAARFFRGRRHGSWVPGYLAGRGFDNVVQRSWQAGYAPAGWDALTTHLRTIGYHDPVIEAVGLARRSRRGTLIDTFRDRVMLPIRAADGTIVAFIGRASDSAGPGVPKYLSGPRTGLYKKSEVLFGLWQARGALARGARPVIVEGPFDAIAITAPCKHRYAGIATLGTALTARQAAALAGAADLPATGVLVAFDGDPAGRRAAVRAYRLMADVTAKVSAVDLPAGCDPAQILCDHGPAVLTRTLAGHTRPLADLVIDAEVDGWSQWLQYARRAKSARSALPPRASPPCRQPTSPVRSPASLSGSAWTTRP